MNVSLHNLPPLLPETPERDLSVNLSRLRLVPLFQGLTDDELTQLARVMTLRHDTQQTTLFHYGEAGESMFFICSGRVKFFHEDDAGREFALEEVGEGAFFGEVATLKPNGRRTATARVTQDLVALELKREDLLDLLPNHPELTLALLGGMAARLSRSGNQIRYNITSNISRVVEAKATPQDRLVHRLARHCGSFGLLAGNAVLVAVWLVLTMRLGHRPFDGPSFNALSLLLAIESLVITAVVLNSANRQADADAMRDNEEHKATLAAEQEIRYVRQELAALRAELHHDHHDSRAHHRPRV